MARSLVESPSPSQRIPTGAGEYRPLSHDISETAGFMIVMVFLICMILNFALRLFLAAKYNQWLQRQARAAALSQPKLGLRPEEISLLPKLVYYPSSTNIGSSLECAVCINEFVDGEMIRVLPICKHFFHVECIDRWLCSHSSCPICRAHPEPEKVKLGNVSVSPPLPGLKSPPEASAQLESQVMSTPRAAHLHEIRVEVQTLEEELACRCI